MPKVTFEDFVHEKFIGRELLDNPDARKIFDIMNDDANIAKAIELSEEGKPALLASVDAIEDFFECTRDTTTFRLDEPRNCQMIGRMQRTIMTACGYKPVANKPMPTLYFHSAMTYKKE